MSSSDNCRSRRMSLASDGNHWKSSYTSSPRASIYSSSRRSSIFGPPKNELRASVQSSSNRRRSSTYDIPRTDNWPVRISATRASGNGARWADRLDSSTTSGFAMIPTPRQEVDPSYSENLKLYLSVLRDSRNRTEEDKKIMNENEPEEAEFERLGLSMSGGWHEKTSEMEVWDGSGNDGLGFALDALSGKLWRIQAPIGLRDAAAGKGGTESRQKRLSQDFFGNSRRLSGAW